MNKKIISLMAVLLVAAATLLPAADDAAGCKDHQLFPTRMPDYVIEKCVVQDFGSYEFNVGKPPKKSVEGKYTYLTYFFTGAKGSEPSPLEVIRNYENAVRKINGTILFSDPKWLLTARIEKEGREAWVEVMKGNFRIWIKIIEKSAMTQHIEASAEIFANDIRANGHAAVYGINFDSDSSLIRPESAMAIGEIAKLLKSDAGLRIYVVGHTDNTGTPEHNLKLSQERAQAVMQELMAKHGIASGRLKAFGCGQYAPVASNDSEEGRAKNRRVELVKQ